MNLPDAAPPTTRVSNEARLATLREWLLMGMPAELAVDKAVKSWPVRASQIREDLAAIQAGWAKDAEGVDELADVWKSKLQREWLFFRAMTEANACTESKDRARLLFLAHGTMRERDRLMRQIVDLRRERQQLRSERQQPAKSAQNASVSPEDLARLTKLEQVMGVPAAPPAAPIPTPAVAAASLPHPHLHPHLNPAPAPALAPPSTTPAAASAPTGSDQDADYARDLARLAEIEQAMTALGLPLVSSDALEAMVKDAQAQPKHSASTRKNDKLERLFNAQMLGGPKDTGFCPISLTGERNGKPALADSATSGH